MKNQTVLDEIKLNVKEINEIQPTQFMLGYRNGFVYFEDSYTHETYLNSAATKRELLTALRAFKMGLLWSKNN